jgi:heme-degrading monooxygenase HmoA
MRRLPMLVMFVVVFTLAVTACGSGDGDNESEGAEGAKIDCRADAFEGDPGLPENFPTPAEFTVTKSTEEGPTTVVVGYWESDLEEAYNEWKDQVEEAGFNVTFDEKEDKDAEVAYEGSGKTGIVQLRDRCNEEEVTYVRITSRPE